MPSLYERLGGLDALMSVADAFVARVGADDRINRKFARSDIPRLKKEFVEQLCAATGGPCEYTGRQMTETHRGMAVTGGEWDAFFEDLAATLNEAGVPESDQDELVGLITPMRGEIVEIESPATGTPLPDNFLPAPPLETMSAGIHLMRDGGDPLYIGCIIEGRLIRRTGELFVNSRAPNDPLGRPQDEGGT